MSTEQDPNGKSEKEPGAKLDFGKAPIRQGVLEYFPRALKAVALVSLFGARKYSWKGWESVPDGINRYGDAGSRHIVEGAIKEELPDADKPLLEMLQTDDVAVVHAAQEAWNALARLELMLTAKT